jgi:hypothetical protein
LSSATLTCRCRFCGYILCYPKEDVGTDAHCPQCGQSIRLPGKLASVSTIIRRRQKNPLGIGLEILGFISMFFLPPWGLIGGGVLITIGWRRSNILICENCGTRLRSRDLESCLKCRCKFTEV